MVDTSKIVSTYYIVATAEASANLARFDGVRFGNRQGDAGLKDMYVQTKSQGFGEEVQKRIMLGSFVLSSGYYDAYYIKAQKVRRLIKQDFDQASDPGFQTNFNTPEHKFKATFGNAELFKNFGFNVAYRFSDDYYWEATFGDGLVPEFHVLDAQVNFKIPSLKSTIKVGGTNLLGEEYFTAYGTGLIGSMYYVSLTINN